MKKRCPFTNKEISSCFYYYDGEDVKHMFLDHYEVTEILLKMALNTNVGPQIL
jgi:hypothetical protein